MATATPSFSVSGATYTFAGKGYAVDLPAGWQARASVSFDVAGARFPTDAFVAPETTSGIQPSISFSCLKPRASEATTTTFRDAWKSFLKQLLSIDVQPTPTTVAQQPAYVFAYQQNQANGGTVNAARTDVVFVAGGCRWMITLLAPPEQQAADRRILDATLATFRLLGG